MWDIDADALTAPLPAVLWVELTSRCPFDCVFCSRKMLRGRGEDMPFDLYRSLIGQLESPAIIRLNYSGESAHYPQLIEAIELAHQAGAVTELVSAFASMPSKQVVALAESPLDRLSVSLHTMDSGQFEDLYGFGSLDDLLRKVDQFARARNRRVRPALDFAFVAMDRNLDQLGAVASFASSIGGEGITVHPVLRRDPIPTQFVAELDESQRLRPAFQQRVLETVAQVRASIPGLEIAVANPAVASSDLLSASPRAFSGPLPAGARIWSCEQNPWRTMHVLANGDVVACEIHDKTPLGNLKRQRLRDIWRGKTYHEFRRAYHRGELHACRHCPWKVAYRPGQMLSWISGAQGRNPQLLDGWYDEEPSGIFWSGPRAAAVIASRPGATAIRLRGLLPPDRRSRDNRLEIRCNGAVCGTVLNRGADMLDFDRVFEVQDAARERWDLRFTTAIAFRGPDQDWNDDERDLGFALVWVQAQERSPARARIVRRLALVPLAASVYGVDLACGVLRRVVRPRLSAVPPPAPGVSVVIPERGNPDLLARCIGSTTVAGENLGQPYEIIVVVNGTSEDQYQELRARFERVRWIHIAKPLGFSSAVKLGADVARFGWIYLANNDIEIDPAGLVNAVALGGPDVFAVGSRILPADVAMTRQETNLTAFHFANGVVEIFDAMPEGTGPRPSFYAGGGSSLFRADVLREFLTISGTYDPFYWEDVEWAARARKKYGLRTVFSDASRVVHQRRATVSKFYPAMEVERIVRRNGLLYQLRNVTQDGSLVALFEEIARSDWLTLREILKRAGSVLAARAATFFYGADDRALRDLRG